MLFSLAELILRSLACNNTHFSDKVLLLDLGHAGRAREENNKLVHNIEKKTTGSLNDT